MPDTVSMDPWDSPGKNFGVGWHALLQVIFPINEVRAKSCFCPKH